jgi:hypothetical protein
MRSHKLIDGVVWDGKDPKVRRRLQGQGLKCRPSHRKEHHGQCRLRPPRSPPYGRKSAMPVHQRRSLKDIMSPRYHSRRRAAAGRNAPPSPPAQTERGQPIDWRRRFLPRLPPVLGLAC